MEHKEILTLTEQYVQKNLKSDPGHDLGHACRVRILALKIAKKEKCDLFIVELAALLHDIADHKFHSGDDMLRATLSWLRSLRLEESLIFKVANIVENISFKKGKQELSLEGQIVQDADRLDAMGAIGIARAFTYGGFCSNPLYNPNIEPNSSKSTTINHFYEKLFLLKNLMNTKEGKKLAHERHKVMEKFVLQFKKEWDFASELPPPYLYKIISPEDWEKSQRLRYLKLLPIDDKFIHLSKEEQLEKVISQYWQGLPRVILKVCTAKIKGKLVFEKNLNGSNKYYHLYRGKIPLAAVSIVT